MIVKVQKKDEKSFPQNTHLDQSNAYTTLYKNYTQRQSPTISNFWNTNRKLVELNDIKWNSFKSGNTGDPKRGVEVKQIPQYILIIN